MTKEEGFDKLSHIYLVMHGVMQRAMYDQFTVVEYMYILRNHNDQEQLPEYIVSNIQKLEERVKQCEGA